MENKTQPTNAHVQDFLAGITDSQRQADCRTLIMLMQEITEAAPRMWGTTIIGFGDHHYRYASGREGDWFVVGFAPRKQQLTIYLTYGIEQQTDLLARLGKHSLGKACLYLKNLATCDLAVLRELITRAVAQQAKNAQPADG